MNLKTKFFSLLALALSCLANAKDRPEAIRYILENRDSSAVLSVHAEISDVFSWIVENPNDESAWVAIHEYRKHTDAGISLEFLRHCHFAIKASPSVFWDRYEKGDELALF